MLRRARVPAPAARLPRGGPPPKAAAAEEAPAPAPAAGGGGLRVHLLRAAVDAVLYASLAALWGHTFAGPVVEILGRWACGKGSAAEAAGLAVAACSKFVTVLLAPSYFPLMMMRVGEHAEFHREEQEKEKLASNQIVTMESVNEQLQKKKGAPRPWLPKGVKLAPLYGFLPMFLLQFLVIMMLLHLEEGSPMWKAADVLFDITRLGIGIMTGVWAVPNLVILVRVPKAKGEDDETQ